MRRLWCRLFGHEWITMEQYAYDFKRIEWMIRACCRCEEEETWWPELERILTR